MKEGRKDEKKERRGRMGVFNRYFQENIEINNSRQFKETRSRRIDFKIKKIQIREHGVDKVSRGLKCPSIYRQKFLIQEEFELKTIILSITKE